MQTMTTIINHACLRLFSLDLSIIPLGLIPAAA